jgi:hypothetical protein
MSGYDAGSLIVTASTSDDILRLTGPDNGREMIGAMDAFDHDLNFEANDLLYDFLPLCYNCNHDARLLLQVTQC